MKTLRSSAWIFLTLFVLAALLNGQKTAPPAPPQTARQALLEMISGGQQGVMKHLTVEAQQLLSKKENSVALASVSMLGSLSDQTGGELQTFDAGPVLLSFNDPKERAKIEVRVENDDLDGDEDTVELSCHLLRDGQEQQEDWTYFMSHLNVTMVRQQNVWRLSKIGVGVELPLGDPEFLKKMFLKEGGNGGMVGGKIGPEAHTELKVTESAPPVELPPPQVLVMLGAAEHSYASQHPEIGFTCSLADLAEAARGFVPNQQVTSGTYGAYKVNLMGCQGKPAGSFQITLETASPTAGGKAFCMDATGNVRISDDGRGATCLISGRVEANTVDEEGATGVGIVLPGSANMPRK